MSRALTTPGKVFIVSAPSGGGKGTLIGRAFKANARLREAVSATTRAPRPGEVDGRDYFFLDEPTFRQWIEEGRFVEWAEVHAALYGTLHSELDRLLEEGHDVVIELDVQGKRSLAKLRDDVVSIFIKPPSMEVLEERLRGRGDVTPEALELRLKAAEAEIEASGEYDHLVVNDDLDTAAGRFEAILGGE